jgi:hypothetical protein
MNTNPRRDNYLANTIPYIAVKTRVPSYRANGTPYLYKPPASEHRLMATQRLQSYILVGAQSVLEAPPGIFTWIIKQFPNGKIILIAARPRCNQEIGTLHANLDQFTAKGTVLIAGELEKMPDGRIIFNFLSGTYSLPLFEKSRKEGKEPDLPLYQSWVQAHLPGATYIDAPILERALIPTCPTAATNLNLWFPIVPVPQAIGGRRTRKRLTRARSRRNVRRR